jgi:hypothetical protein
VDQVDIRKLTRGDIAVLTYLKASQPALYRRLKTQATQQRSPHRRRPSRR